MESLGCDELPRFSEMGGNSPLTLWTASIAATPSFCCGGSTKHELGLTCKMLCNKLWASAVTLCCAFSNSSSTSFLNTLPNKATWALKGEKCSMAASIEVSHCVMSCLMPYLEIRKASRCCSIVSLGWHCSADLQTWRRNMTGKSLLL